MADPQVISEASRMADIADTVIKVSAGGAVVGFFVMVSRLYRVYKTGKSLEQKYEHVTDETIRKELWTQWAIAIEANKKQGEELARVKLDMQKLRGMHSNCIEISGAQTHEINSLKARIQELEK